MCAPTVEGQVWQRGARPAMQAPTREVSGVVVEHRYQYGDLADEFKRIDLQTID
jgi:hypothetical protein